MDRVLVSASLVLCCTGAAAAEGTPAWAIDRSDLELVDSAASAQADLNEPVRAARARLSLMRADGVEIAWIEGDVEFDETQAFSSGFGSLPIDTIRFDPGVIDGHAAEPLLIGDGLEFRVDRSTALHDGGISGSSGALDDGTGPLRLPSSATSAGEFDLYDIALDWDAATHGPVTVSFTGGIKAIDARIGKVVNRGGVSSFEDARGVVAVPVVGGGVSWEIAEGFALSGRALTQTLSDSGSVLDFTAETSLQLTPNVGISAGYQVIRAAIEVQSLGTELSEEGVFARIQIRF